MICEDNKLYEAYMWSWTHKHLETHECVLSIIAIDALMLKHKYLVLFIVMPYNDIKLGQHWLR